LLELGQWVNDKRANLLEALEDVKRDWAAYLARHASSFRPPGDDAITLGPVGRAAVELVPGSLAL
jgi:hypothetical protein